MAWPGAATSVYRVLNKQVLLLVPLLAPLPPQQPAHLPHPLESAGCLWLGFGALPSASWQGLASAAAFRNLNASCRPIFSRLPTAMSNSRGTDSCMSNEPWALHCASQQFCYLPLCTLVCVGYPNHPMLFPSTSPHQTRCILAPVAEEPKPKQRVGVISLLFLPLFPLLHCRVPSTIAYGLS